MTTDEARGPLRVVELQVENIKGIKALTIRPTTDVVVVAGANGAGKTSTLDAIEYVLAGTRAQAGTPRPIRDGETEARGKVDLGDFTVERTWKNGKQSLVVMSKDGGKYSTPQKFLDELLGKLSFDPLAFSSLAPKEQLAQMLQLADLSIDPEELSRQRTTTFDERTEIGRQKKTAEATIAGRPEPTEDEMVEESLAVLAEQFSAVQGEIERQASLRRDFKTKADRVATLRAELAEAEAALVPVMTAVGNLPDEPPSTLEISERMSTVEERNQNAREATTLAAHHAALRRLTEEYDAKSAVLDEIDRTKATALAEAQIPIDGLGFDDDGITYNGIPFSQCSAAERLRISLMIAMLANPTIRVIKVPDASLLDEANLELIRQMAGDQGYQVWLEMVGHAVGFVIEDGELAS